LSQNLQTIEHEQRDDDSEDAVAERFNARQMQFASAEAIKKIHGESRLTSRMMICWKSVNMAKLPHQVLARFMAVSVLACIISLVKAAKVRTRAGRSRNEFSLDRVGNT
jgi:hypothetical protein